MKILKLSPYVADNIWGGTKLRECFDIQSDKERLAEAWVLSCHPKGESMITGGDFDGRTLSSVLENEGRSYLGTDCGRFDFFPVLIKLIDAKDDLSIQVHPDDGYALAHENQFGKTECWYILDADPGAEIIFGLSKLLTREQLEEIIEKDEISEYVNRVKVRPGQLFFIPSGTVHAICRGVLLAEVQQNSDITYRISDYGRLQNGKPRELHKKQAAEVIDLSPISTDGRPQGVPVEKDGYTETLLVECPLFTTSVLDVEEEAELEVDGRSFVSLVALDGNAVICSGDSYITFYKGESVFVPASFGKLKIMGSVKVLKTFV